MNIIVAQLENGVIGMDNTLPWRNVLSCSDISKQDMAFFKEMTTGCSLVMGWNTWVSLGQKPLKNRDTHYIITSKNIEDDLKNNIRFVTFNDFISMLPQINNDDLWCIGGATLYKALKKYCKKLYISYMKPASLIKMDNHILTYLDLVAQEDDETLKGKIILNREFPATGNKITIWEYTQEPFINNQR